MKKGKRVGEGAIREWWERDDGRGREGDDMGEGEGGNDGGGRGRR